MGPISALGFKSPVDLLDPEIRNKNLMTRWIFPWNSLAVWLLSPASGPRADQFGGRIVRWQDYGKIELFFIRTYGKRSNHWLSQDRTMFFILTYGKIEPFFHTESTSKLRTWATSRGWRKSQSAGQISVWISNLLQMQPFVVRADWNLEHELFVEIWCGSLQEELTILIAAVGSKSAEISGLLG